MPSCKQYSCGLDWIYAQAIDMHNRFTFSRPIQEPKLDVKINKALRYYKLVRKQSLNERKTDNDSKLFINIQEVTLQ